MKLKQKKPRAGTHRSQWAAQFAVASELVKRDYDVGLTMGNHPLTDLMVVSPKKTSFVVDVKGLKSVNAFPIRNRVSGLSMFYVLVLVPARAQNQYFILSESEALEEIKKDLVRWKAQCLKKGRVADEKKYVTGIGWQNCQKYKDAWDTLPQ